MSSTTALTLIAVGYVAAFGVTATLGAYAFFYRDDDVADWFGRTMDALALWALGALARLFASTMPAWRVATAVMYLGIVTMPVAFLLFALSYAGRSPDQRTALVLLAPPAVSYLGLLTNPAHELFYRTVDREIVAGITTFTGTTGPLFWLHTVYSYGLLLGAVAMVVRFAVGNHRLYREQSVALLVGAAVPIVVNAAYITNVVPLPVDPTPLAFALSGLLFALAVFEVRLIDLTPVARSAVVNTISDGVLVVGVDSEVLDSNPAADDVVRAGDPVGRDLEAVLPPELVGSDGEVSELTVDGDRRWIRRNDIPLAEDRPGRVVLLTDLTEERRTQRRLREQNRRLEEFTSVAAHDLRNPLNVIDGYVERVRETGDLSHLDSVAEATDRMETLVEDLLELGQHARMVEDREQVGLEPVARRAWSSLETDDADLVVADDCDVDADPPRFRRLLENLLDNAVVHAGPDATVRVGTLADSRGFFVSDDGEGVPPGEREDVFEYGYSTHPNGTGLGLPIVRGIAEAHGWSVTVTESAAGGARFEVSGTV